MGDSSPTSRWSARGRRRAGFRAFLQHPLQRLFVQAEVGHQLLQLEVFLLQDPQAPHLGHAHALELFRPPVEGLLANPNLPADLVNRRAFLRLSRAQGHLPRGTPGTLHGTILLTFRFRSSRKTRISTGTGSGEQITFSSRRAPQYLTIRRLLQAGKHHQFERAARSRSGRPEPRKTASPTDSPPEPKQSSSLKSSSLSRDPSNPPQLL